MQHPMRMVSPAIRRPWRRADVGRGSDVSWMVMADPDGNEFCVLRALTAEEMAAQRKIVVQ